MNCEFMFQDFNPGKFIVWVCLLVFTVLLSLRLDDKIDWSYWAVFTPIWIWKSLVILGALIGSVVWWKNPNCRLEGQSYVQYRALLISLGLHIFILMFEVLVADNLENDRHTWISVFAPLILISKVSVAACIWAVKHDRAFELELFCSVNLLQFVFLALKLDGHIAWPWEVVFAPIWILLCVSVAAVLYTVIFASLMIRITNTNLERRRTSLKAAIAYTWLVAPILIFMIMLTCKLQGTKSVSWAMIVGPLYFSYAALIVMSFSSKKANQWWFGLQRDACQFILGVCPLLQEYANVSYTFNREGNGEPSVQTPPTKVKREFKINRKEQKAVVPVYSLDMPD